MNSKEALRARLEAKAKRKPSTPFVDRRGKQKETKGGRQEPVALLHKREEASLLVRTAKANHARRVMEACVEHPNFEKYLSILLREEPQTWVSTPGVVDLDLSHLITSTGLKKLPHPVRWLALQETSDWIRRIHKRHRKSECLVNWTHLFDPDWVDSLAEAKTALNMM